MIEIREIPEADVGRMVELAGLVFHVRIEGDGRDGWRVRRAERFGAFDGGALAGQAAAIPMRLAVPGGFLGCSAVSYVGVLPTHRRRGVLTALMERVHADAAAAGRPVAALWASQGGIYGRFGYGLATRAIGLEIDSSRPLELRTAPDDRPLRLVDPESAAEVIGPLHTRALAARPGGFLRDEEWWRRGILPPVDVEGAPGFTEPRVVVHPAGYAVYRTSEEGTVRVADLVGETPRAEAALWRYLASIDLTGRVEAPNRPVDDLLPHMAADPDQVVVKKDAGALWLRLVDVPAALRSRSWAAGDAFVLEVRDERIPANDGRWRLATGAAPACDRTGAEPDLTLSAADLAAAYLGGMRVSTLVRVGVVTEHTPGAAARLDAALAVPLAPYMNDDF
ncbi:GNAT family N-acetyltransferase [Actinomadura welshii]